MNIAELLGRVNRGNKIRVAWYGDKEDPVSVTLEDETYGDICLHLRDDEYGNIEVGSIDEEGCDEYAQCKRLTSIEMDTVQLEVGECECGYHFTVDATFLEQVKDFKFRCRSCGRIIDTAEVF